MIAGYVGSSDKLDQAKMGGGGDEPLLAGSVLSLNGGYPSQIGHRPLVKSRLLHLDLAYGAQ